MKQWTARTERERQDKKRVSISNLRAWIARVLLRSAAALSAESVRGLVPAGTEAPRAAEAVAEALVPADDPAGPPAHWLARVRDGAPELLLRPEWGGTRPATFRKPPAWDQAETAPHASERGKEPERQHAVETALSRSALFPAPRQRAEDGETSVPRRWRQDSAAANPSTATERGTGDGKGEKKQIVRAVGGESPARVERPRQAEKLTEAPKATSSRTAPPRSEYTVVPSGERFRPVSSASTPRDASFPKEKFRAGRAATSDSGPRAVPLQARSDRSGPEPPSAPQGARRNEVDGAVSSTGQEPNREPLAEEGYARPRTSEWVGIFANDPQRSGPNARSRFSDSFEDSGHRRTEWPALAVSRSAASLPQSAATAFSAQPSPGQAETLQPPRVAGVLDPYASSPSSAPSRRTEEDDRWVSLPDEAWPEEDPWLHAMTDADHWGAVSAEQRGGR